MRIGIDFDEVVADSMTTIIRLHNEQYGTHLTRADFTSYIFENIWGGTREEAIKKVDEFFDTDQVKEIDPMAGSIKGVRMLKEQGHELYIIAGRNERNMAQTERWIEHHFKDVFKGVHYAHFFTLDKNVVTRKKLDICKELGIELLIDDNLPTALECAEGGLKVFLFDQRWNLHDALPQGVTRVHSWDEIVEKIPSEIKLTKESKGYKEHVSKVVETGGKFEHVMAITLDPRTSYRDAVIRCITSRVGDVATSGYVDRSALYRAHGNSLDHFSIGEELRIKNQDAIIERLSGEDSDFLGLEDPDIWIDEKTGLIHLYFTMPFRSKTKDEFLIHLGHAVGKDLDSLDMTMPVLMDEGKGGAKEVSIAPVNEKGIRYNLVESSIREDDFTYSTVRIGIAGDMGKPWKFGGTVFHPKEHGIPWIGGHASPGPLLPRDFIDMGGGKLLGIMNGREANRRVGHEIKYGMFSIGLFIYDYENGKIDWVSPEPFIQDSQARTITFASQFVGQGKESGTLYAHVDDSFVRAYTLDAEEIKSLLPRV